jgi:hypothetical protein
VTRSLSGSLGLRVHDVDRGRVTAIAPFRRRVRQPLVHERPQRLGSRVHPRPHHDRAALGSMQRTNPKTAARPEHSEERGGALDGLQDRLEEAGQLSSDYLWGDDGGEVPDAGNLADLRVGDMVGDVPRGISEHRREQSLAGGQ